MNGISIYKSRLIKFAADKTKAEAVKAESISVKPWSLWDMRPHQKEVYSKLFNYDRVILIWHRRAGKDILALNYILDRAMQRKGIYWHVFTTYAQGKLVIWESIDSKGNRLIDAIPGVKNNTEMSIELPNGSKYRIIGADRNPDSIRSANPVGVVFSEFSYMKPDMWDSVYPILVENKGWAMFLYTPNGQNFAYDMYNMAKNNDEWYVEIKGNNETKLLTDDDIEKVRLNGVSEEMIQQEYYCKFLSYAYGSYFSKLLNARKDAGYITELNIQLSAPINTYWDIGNHTSIWFVQKQGEHFCVVDYLEGQGLTFEYFLLELKKRAYMYGKHVFPHDMINKEHNTSGQSRFDTAKDVAVNIDLQGIFEIQNKMSLKEGMHMTTQFIDKCKIDNIKCKLGLSALSDYKRAHDKKNKKFLDYPEKNQWSSHATDAFRYAAIDCLTADVSKDRLVYTGKLTYNDKPLRL